MIRVADYITKKLVDYGVKDIFMISGGGAIFLNDAVGRTSGLSYICNQHEQASSMAAEGYAKSTGKLAVVCVTTGPGGTNTITGLMGQWLDSIPVLYLSGQVKYLTTIASCPELGLRQLGDQEINIVDVVRPLTKYAKMITSPEEIKIELDKAIQIALEGRQGPVWLDIPINIQSALIEEEELKDEVVLPQEDLKGEVLEEKITQIIELLKKAKRPLILAGHGIRMGGAIDLFEKFKEVISVPIVSSFNGFDLMTTEDELFVGRVGTIGDRGGNFALQNADLLLCLGTRNNIRQVGYNWEDFAARATKVVVDIDERELNKPTVKPDIPIHIDVKYFFEIFLKKVQLEELPGWNEWKSWCRDKKNRYPVVLEDYKKQTVINPYYFVEELSHRLKEKEIVITGNGTCSVCYFQAGVVKKGQRVIWNSGCASMGYDLPTAIGAAVAHPSKRVICLAGDGSLQMNIQELETLKYYNLPVKLFILDNQGYISIKQTQDNLFEGFKVASDPLHGVGIPDFKKIAEAYGIKTRVIQNTSEFYKLDEVLEEEGPVVCVVKLQTDYIFSPKSASKKLEDGRIVSMPLDDMFPFLKREEYENNQVKEDENV